LLKAFVPRGRFPTSFGLLVRSIGRTAADLARVLLKEKPLAAYYDEILLEGLRLAQVDAQRGLLDEDRMHRIRDAVAEIVDDHAMHTDAIKVHADPAEEDSRLAQLEKAEARVRKKRCRSVGATANQSCAYPGRVSSTRPWRRWSSGQNTVESVRAPKRLMRCRCLAS
jgi:hypothetical protein